MILCAAMLLCDFVNITISVPTGTELPPGLLHLVGGGACSYLLFVFQLSNCAFHFFLSHSLIF